MKNPASSLLLILACAVSARLAAQGAGAPAPTGAETGGYWAAGVSGVHSSGSGAGLGQADTLMAFVEAGWDFSPRLEGYLEFGGIDSRGRIDGATARSGVTPLLGAGLRALPWRRGDYSVILDAGVTGYGDFERRSTERAGPVVVTVTETQRHPRDAGLLALIQRQKEPWAFFAGPLFYAYRAEVVTVTAGTLATRTTRETLSTTDAGALAGVRRAFGAGWEITLQAGYRGGGFFGAGIQYVH